MKKVLVAQLMVLLLFLTPAFTMAADFTGTIQGFVCVTEGKTCPIGREDYMAAVENVFVLLVDAAKGEYYFLPNVDKEILVRYINVQIKVSGDLDKKFKAIKVREIYTMKDKTAKKVWASDKWDELYQGIYTQ